jgi:hypothetical protein
MSNDNPAFDADISSGDPTLFAPLLVEDLTTLPPPFHITNPLQGPDFANREDNDFLCVLNTTNDAFSQGIIDDPKANVNCSLTRSQFIQGATQSLTAIMEGIRSSFPLSDTPVFLRELSPDELKDFKVFAEATAALNRYLTDPTAQNPNHWLQCLRCLQVAHISVTEDNWWAHFATANQHTATARTTILNTTICNFSTKALRRVDMVRIKAWDQIVMWVITANPPPADTDPHILEWIDCEAARLKADTEMKAIARADNNALTLHNRQMEVIRSRLDADLQLLRDETDKALNATRERAQQELADLQAQIRVQREITKAELLDEAACTARKDRTTCAKKQPNPLNSTTHSHSSSIALATPVPMEMANDLPPPLEYQLPSEATQIV